MFLVEGKWIRGHLAVSTDSYVLDRRERMSNKKFFYYFYRYLDVGEEPHFSIVFYYNY